MKRIKINRGKVVQICNWFSLPLQFLGVCLLYLIMEAICRHSFYDAVSYMLDSRLVFLYNAFLIFVTTTLVYLTRRRIFARTLIFAIWLILGIINGVVLACRVTPFTGPDLKLVTESLRILNKYLSVGMVVVVIILFILLIAGLVFLAVKAPKYKGKMYYRLNIPLVIVAAASFLLVTNLALKERVLSSYFGNIAFAYEDYGFPYCLGTTFFNTGIDCPNGYGEELMQKIVRSTQTNEKTELPEEPVNIVFLQLESFFDPELVEFLKLSEDPIPNFRKLMKEYTSGYFRVPSVGAGTANTEFETITGMSLHYFGPGEYPYKSVLQDKTCESVPYVLKGLGYSTHAIHNNEANFYSRRKVFANLGFQTFTSEEYMPDISDTTPTDWVKDYILTDEIMKCLEATEGPDYVYTISVQGHGDYPTEPVLDDPEITVTGAENREKNNYSWEYYVNQLKEMDDFIQELVDTLEDYDEPVVLVMYGDHLPTMGLTAEDVENRYLFQTQYVMWDNMGLEKDDVNLASYQIGAEVLDRIGIHDGTVISYHQTRKGTKNYQVDLEALQYDILYGEQYVYQGQDPFMKTDLQLGVVPITFTGVNRMTDGTYYISGTNFTASSKLEINRELVEDTIYISPTLLMVRDVVLEDGDSLTVAQQSNSSTHRVLSRTDELIYEETVPDSEDPELTSIPE
ncbi:MAG: sulfatase-like hydrolase/transferase [Ruminococcus sp.]|jgi:hypothetical protein